ncbi:MAG: hypothetical protein QXY39_09045 [Thermofilaceae archaeon]
MLHSRRLAVIAFALLVAAAALAAMMLFRPEQRAKGVGEQRFYVRITHEGCAGNFQLYPDPLMKRNFFRRGELAAFEFEVSNPNDSDLKVELLLAPLDKPQQLLKVGEGAAPARRVTRLWFEVDTASLEPALYRAALRVVGVGEFDSNTEPFRRTNLDSYPWLLAVLDEPVRWEAPEGGLPRLIVPEGLGVNIHFIAPSPFELRDLDMIAYAGFKLIRMDLFWSTVERERGAYDFSGYDALTSALKERGLRPLYILCYGNPLYDGGQPPRSEEARSAYASYAGAAASRYGAYALWEVWNEPNIEVFWKPQPSAPDYARLLAAVSRAIKESCPSCLVLAPATSGVDVEFVRALAVRGALELVDAVSVHPYRGGPPETVLTDYERLRSVVGDKTIICSEWGYTTGGAYANRVDVVTQAHYSLRIYLTNLMAGVPLTIIYDWKDDGLSLADSEHNFGLVAHHVRGPEWFFIKPAYYAIYNFNRELAGYAPKEGRALGEGAYLLVLQRGEEMRLVVWTSGPARTVKLSLGSQRALVIRTFGLREVVEAIGGELELEVDGAPVIVAPLKG